MVVLPAADWTASEIAGLLHHDPKTVRTWIARHHAGLPDRPRPPTTPQTQPAPRRTHPHCAADTPILDHHPDRQSLDGPQLSRSTMRRRIRQQARWTRPHLTTAAPWTSPWLPERYGKESWPGA